MPMKISNRNLSPLFAASLLCLFSLLFLPLPADAHDPDQVIKFGVFPYKSPRTTFDLFGPIAKRIQEKTGKKVELVSAPDYNTYIERGKAGLYDLALPCVTCFFKMQEAGYHVIARGEPSFHGGIVVRKDSGINAVEQLKGRRIAAIGRHSYAGYIFAKTMLEKNGIDPEQGVTFSFLNKADSIILAVLNRQHDAGVIRVDVLEDNQFQTVRDSLVVLALSPEVPHFPFVVKNSMAPETVTQILDVLLAISPASPADKKLLENLGIERFSLSQDADYQDFRKISNRIDDMSH